MEESKDDDYDIENALIEGDLGKIDDLQAILKRKVALLDAELAKASTMSETSAPEQVEKPTFVRRRDKKTIDKQQK